jgi:hypothetical protein
MAASYIYNTSTQYTVWSDAASQLLWPGEGVQVTAAQAAAQTTQGVLQTVVNGSTPAGIKINAPAKPTGGPSDQERTHR